MSEIQKEDIETALGKKLTPEQEKRLPHLLETAKTAFLSEANILDGTGRIQRRYILKAGELHIRQPGVTQIHAVTDLSGSPIEYQWNARFPKIIRARGNGQLLIVDFSYDYDLPEVAVKRIIEIVARTIVIPEQARAGLGQYSITKGPFTESGTFKEWAVGGQVLLSPEDKRVAHSLSGARRGQTIEVL